MINKTMDLDVKVVDEKEGIIDAFVNTMGVIDHDNDVIEPTAFDKSIGKIGSTGIPVLYGHDQSQIIGKVISAKSVEFDENHKLYARMQINMNKESGRDAFSDIQGKFIEQWSVGFNIPDGGWEMDGSKSKAIRRIKDLDWVEVSAVIRGASPETQTIGAKSLEITPEIEEQPAPDTVETASDAEVVRTKVSILMAQLEAKMPKRKKPKY